MSTDVYLCRHKKDEVSSKVRKVWDSGKSVSHQDDVYLEWTCQYLFFMSVGPCMESLKAVAPDCAKSGSGYVSSDAEFPLSKEKLETFAESIITKDYGNCPDIPEHIPLQVNKLKELIGQLNFDTHYFTIHTD